MPFGDRHHPKTSSIIRSKLDNMVKNFYFLIASFSYISMVTARSYTWNREEYTKPDPEEVDADITLVDCHTHLHGDVMGNRYRLEASTGEENKICDLRVPSHVLIAVEVDFHDPDSYFRIVGTTGRTKQGWTVGLPRIFLKNSTVPYLEHERERTSVWFTPCEQSAILLNAKNSKDAIIFMMKEIRKEKRLQFKDPLSCNNEFDLF